MNISEERLKQLEDVEKKMEALERGGVDNWEFYGESLDEYWKEKHEEEGIEKLFLEICESLCVGAYEPSERGAGIAFTEEAQSEALKILKEGFAEMVNERESNN